MLKVGSKVAILKYWDGCSGFIVREYPAREYPAGNWTVVATEGKFAGVVGCFSSAELRGLPGRVSTEQLKALCHILGVRP